MRRAVLLILPLLAACAGSEPGAPTEADRQAAHDFTVSSIETLYPAYRQADALADCVVAHATDRETLQLAGRDRGLTDRSRRTLATAIAVRPDATACRQAKNLPRLQ